MRVAVVAERKQTKANWSSTGGEWRCKWKACTLDLADTAARTVEEHYSRQVNAHYERVQMCLVQVANKAMH